LCGREIDARFLVQMHAQIRDLRIAMMARKLWNDDLAKSFSVVHVMLSSIPHLRFHDLERFNVDRVALNLNARKAFVSNSMSLSRFKQTILRNQLLMNKHESIAQIIHAVVQAATDIAFRFQHFIAQTHTQIQTIHAAHDFAHELFNLKTYANDELTLIHNDFHSTPSKLAFFATFDFKITHHKPFTRSLPHTPFPLTF